MQVDVSFSVAKVYNVAQDIDVIVGQKLSLLTDSTTPLLWFAQNDSALAITESDFSADVESLTIGKSIILIMDQNLTPVRKIVINVVAEIDMAKNLNATGDNPVPKV